MSRSIGDKLRSVRLVGFRRSARILVDRSFLSMLRKVYGFHPWHVDAPLSARPYRHTVAELVNDLAPRCVVEVGCGIGAILSLVKAPERYGYDLDAGAIRAARVLRDRRIAFVEGDFGSVDLAKIDVLIMVNWIHDISPERLEAWISPLLSRTSYLVVDAVDEAGPEGYRYKHDFGFLGPRARRQRTTRVASEGRDFLVFAVVR
ncbi:MAG TPA: class I SAM-dependent methyltransferase [Rhodothermales bacterium]|nr:class I SAM-dependent methyltransferase [Rhodothermales bacterium]